MSEDIKKDLSNKKIIGVQVDADLNNALNDLAADYGISISGLIRLITIDYLKRYKGFEPKKGIKK